MRTRTNPLTPRIQERQRLLTCARLYFLYETRMGVTDILASGIEL